MERTTAIASLIGGSAAMRLVQQQIRTLAPVDTTVLIEGEIGTGKTEVARALHEASPRRGGRFVAVNGVGLPDVPLASRWFGHRRGAFMGAITDRVGLFETAGGGTLMLDEIGDIPMSMQPQLLRVLQEREILPVGDSRTRPIDVRVLATTHRDLDHEVLVGRFRQDLFYRIRVARIILPALRDRREDIPVLAAAFLQQAAAAHGKAASTIDAEAMQRLTRYRWPGNVRELASTMEWAAIRAAGRIIRAADLPPEFFEGGVPPPHAALSLLDRRRILDTLQQTGGNRSVAARRLGISRATLYRRLAAFGKDDPDTV